MNCDSSYSHRQVLKNLLRLHKISSVRKRLDCVIWPQILPITSLLRTLVCWNIDDSDILLRNILISQSTRSTVLNIGFSCSCKCIEQKQSQPQLQPLQLLPSQLTYLNQKRILMAVTKVHLRIPPF